MTHARTLNALLATHGVQEADQVWTSDVRDVLVKGWHIQTGAYKSNS